MVRAAPLPLLLCACDGGASLDLGILTTDLADGRLGLAYSARLEADTESGDGTWSVVAGELPLGLSLSGDGETALIDGTPERSGDSTFTVAIDDLDLHDERDFTLHVHPICLMSGFEPFGGYPTNPSIEALLPLHEQLVGDLDVRVVELPVVWDEAWDVLHDEIDLFDPSVVIATGQAGSDAMRFETVAQNVEYGVDNDGVERSGEPVVEGGPETLADRLPEAEMSAAMEEAGYATTISSNAGTYLCNFTFYRLMYYAEVEAGRDLTAGFIHVSPASAGYEFTVEDITAAHRAGLEALSAWLLSGAVPSPTLPAGTTAAPVYFGAGQP